MKSRSYEFYQNLYPWLDESWEHTGAEAYGLVWWWKPINSLYSEDISATTRIGYVQAPNHGYFFVRLDTEDYPQVQETQRLTLTIKTDSNTLLKEANQVALEVFAGLIVVAKEKRREFEEKLKRPR